MHLILLDVSPRQMVHTPSRVPLHLQIRWVESPLFANQDIEVIIRGMNATVSFSTDRSTEDDQVLGNTGMDDVHGTHSTASVVEHPFLGVGVESDDAGGVGFGEVGDDVVNHVICVIGSWCGGDGFLGEFVEVFRSEDIPPVL